MIAWLACLRVRCRCTVQTRKNWKILPLTCGVAPKEATGVWGQPFDLLLETTPSPAVVATAQSTQTRELPPTEPGSDGAAGDGGGGGCGEAGEGVPGAGVPDVPDPRHRPRPPHTVAAHGALRPRRQPRGPRRPRPRALLRCSLDRRRRVPLSREQRHRVAGPGNRVAVPLRPSPPLGLC